MYNKCMRQVNSIVHADQVPSSSAHLLHKTFFHKNRIHHQTTASYTGNESMKISIFNRTCGLSAVTVAGEVFDGVFLCCPSYFFILFLKFKFLVLFLSDLFIFFILFFF